jgi:hypothetical protein
MPQDSIKALPMVTVDAATIGVAYVSLNPPGFAHPVVYYTVVNDSSEPLFISYDGVTDHDIANYELFFFSQMANVPNNRVAMLPQYTQIYGRYLVPTTGNIYISAYYV